VFASQLQMITGIEVLLIDERLTSVEAEAQLAEREKDWKKRKLQIDAVAAAIMLQDFLDARVRG
jgi:putative Holliday junction resolvase